MRQNILESGLWEMAKTQRIYIKTQKRNAVNKTWCRGTATQDKCEMTHASPGPISSLIEIEHKFSVSRTKILPSWDDSWLMVHHHSLHCPCWLDWQVDPASPGYNRVHCGYHHPYTEAGCERHLRLRWRRRRKRLRQLQKQLVPWIFSENKKISALMTSCN